MSANLFGFLFFILGFIGYFWGTNSNPFAQDFAVALVVAGLLMILLEIILDKEMIIPTIGFMLLIGLVYFIELKADYKLPFHCKIYDELKGECVEYSDDKKKIHISLERPFYDTYSCYMKPIRDSSIDEIKIKCLPQEQGSKVVVEIPVNEKLFEESERWKVRVEAEKGKVKEEVSFIVLFEPVIDGKTKKI
ncbi:hypothetical protein [Persephonella sp.]